MILWSWVETYEVYWFTSTLTELGSKSLRAGVLMHANCAYQIILHIVVFMIGALLLGLNLKSKDKWPKSCFKIVCSELLT